MNLMAGSKGYSISAAQGDIAPEHDRREYEPGNVDARLSANNNIIIDTPNEREAFNELFADSIEAYNAGQKRNDRKKSFDYLSEIENGKGAEKPFYEYVFQIGNRDTNGVTTSSFDEEAWKKDKKGYDIMSCANNDADRLKLKEILDSEMASLQKRYPAFHFWSVIGHDDEPNGTYHYHVRFTPVGSGYKNGMEKRCSLTKALNSMGFYTDGGDLAVMQWQNDVKDHIEEAIENEGYHREFMSNEEKHASVSTFKLKKEKEKLVKEAEKAVEDAKAKIAKQQEVAIDMMIDMYIDMGIPFQEDRYLDNQELMEAFLDLQVEQHEIELEKEEAHEQLNAELEAERKETGELKSAAEEQLIRAAKSRREADALKGVYEQKSKEFDNLIAEVKKFVNKPSTVSEDADYGRKAYMENIKMSNGLSAEDAYQKKLEREKKAKADKKAEADAFVKKAEQIREPSKQASPLAKVLRTAKDMTEQESSSDKEYSL